MRLDLEGAGPAVADVDDAGVLARALHRRGSLVAWAAASDARGRICRSSARSTSRCKCPVRSGDGVRPSAASMRAYSSGVRLCCFSSSGEMLAGAGTAGSVLVVMAMPILSHGLKALASRRKNLISRVVAIEFATILMWPGPVRQQPPIQSAPASRHRRAISPKVRGSESPFQLRVSVTHVSPELG